MIGLETGIQAVAIPDKAILGMIPVVLGMHAAPNLMAAVIALVAAVLALVEITLAVAALEADANRLNLTNLI